MDTAIRLHLCVCLLPQRLLLAAADCCPTFACRSAACCRASSSSLFKQSRSATMASYSAVVGPPRQDLTKLQQWAQGGQREARSAAALAQLHGGSAWDLLLLYVHHCCYFTMCPELATGVHAVHLCSWTAWAPTRLPAWACLALHRGKPGLQIVQDLNQLLLEVGKPCLHELHPW